MKCDSQVSLLAHTFASPCFGCEPKARVAIEIIIEKLEKKLEPFSLDKACPHIVRAFKFFNKTLFDKQHHLAHPNKGLTQHIIFHYAHKHNHCYVGCNRLQNFLVPKDAIKR
jgi:hypothetical protein